MKRHSVTSWISLAVINEGKVVGHYVIGKNEWEVCKKTMSFLRAHTITSSAVKAATTTGDPLTTAQTWECKSLKSYVK